MRNKYNDIKNRAAARRSYRHLSSTLHSPLSTLHRRATRQGFTLVDPGCRLRDDMAVECSARKSGFTLVELMVAMALFSIIIAIAVGGFVRALKTQRQLAALLAAESNVSLAIDQMSREIRTGTDFCPIGPSGLSLCDCPIVNAESDTETCNTLAFVNAEGNTVVYALQNSVLEKSSDGGATYIPVTGTNVIIPYFDVTIFGNTAGDHWPPRVTLTLGVSPDDPDLSDQVLHLQTTVSARAIDCNAAGQC